MAEPWTFSRRNQNLQSIRYTYLTAELECESDAREIVESLKLQIDQGCKLGFEHVESMGKGEY